MTFDVATIVGITSAVAVPATAVATFVATKGLDAYLKYRKTITEEKQADRAYEDGREDRATLMLVEELRNNLAAVRQEMQTDREKHREELQGMRDELGKARAAHLECVRSEERTKAENLSLTAQISRLDREITSLREWRHQLANAEHQAVLKNDLLKDAVDPEGNVRQDKLP